MLLTIETLNIELYQVPLVVALKKKIYGWHVHVAINIKVSEPTVLIKKLRFACPYLIHVHKNGKSILLGNKVDVTLLG